MRILIAEDDMASRKFLSKFLSKFGEVEAVENGMEVVDLFAKRMKEGVFFDLVCLDIMMPKVDGYKALTVIRDIERKNGISGEKRAKVIITSALNETESPIEENGREHDAYITKPIDMDKFQRIMKKLGLIGD